MVAPGGELRIGSLRSAAGLVGHHQDEGVQARVVVLDPREARLGGFKRRRLAGSERAAEFFDCGHSYRCVQG